MLGDLKKGVQASLVHAYTQPFGEEIGPKESLSLPILTVSAGTIYFVRGRYSATAQVIANFTWTVARPQSRQVPNIWHLASRNKCPPRTLSLNYLRL